MRALLIFLLVAAAAIAVALFAKLNTGYALFVAPPYRIELSLNAFIVIVVGAFLLVHALLRLIARIARMPRDVRVHRHRQQVESARAKQDAASVALLEGRYGKTRQYAEEALAIPHGSGLAALIGARAAVETRDFAGAAALLARSDVQVTSLAVPRLMLEAEMALEQGQPGDAVAKLDELKREAGSHTAALRLELRALGAAGRHAAIPAVVDQLVKRKVYDPEQGAMLRASAHADALRGLTHDANALRAYWNQLPEAERLHPKVARAAARSFLALGGDRDAAEMVAKSLERDWDAELALIYADCRTADPPRQIETAERWLAAHSQDATLLYALGRLCERNELWGKAQTYYEASLAIDNAWRAHVALGEMHARLGRADQANAHLAAALRLALAELQ